MGLNLEHLNGQTPIDEEEKEGLLISTISTRGELDEFEHFSLWEAFRMIPDLNFHPCLLTAFYI